MYYSICGTQIPDGTVDKASVEKAVDGIWGEWWEHNYSTLWKIEV